MVLLDVLHIAVIERLLLLLLLALLIWTSNGVTWLQLQSIASVIIKHSKL